MRNVRNIAVLLIVVLLSGRVNAEYKIPFLPDLPGPTITVGVRADAKPFSYISASKRDEDILPRYSGYMIEVCRRVLAELIVSGPFSGYEIETRQITADTRFTQLKSGRIDMLCGPDSITLARLYRYNASHPLFLSGITYATVANEHFPRGRYCKGVIGLVGGTTAESEGLRAISERGDLLLYDSALDRFLTVAADYYDAIDANKLLENTKYLSKRIKDSFEDEEKSKLQGVSKIDPELIKTINCPKGFTEGPVIFYDSHQKGIEDLCNGLILFYMADVDILRKRVKGCNVLLHRETLTREAYGVFFRRESEVRFQNGRSEAYTSFDSALYAEFNNILLRKMQTTENILDYEFQAEFKNELPTPDLQIFFEGYKFVTDY